MEGIYTIVFYEINKHLNQKDILNFCQTNKRFKSLAESDYFIETFFAFYYKVNFERIKQEFGINRLDLIKLLVYGYGDLTCLISVCREKIRKCANKMTGKIFICGHYCKRVYVINDEHQLSLAKFSPEQHYDNDKQLSYLDKYFLQFSYVNKGNIIAENILDISEYFILTTANKLFMIDYFSMETNLFQENDITTKEIRKYIKSYKLNLIAENVKEIGDGWYITLNNELYTLHSRENPEFVMSNVKIYEYLFNYIVDHNNIIYKRIYENETFKNIKLYEYDINIIDIMYIGNTKTLIVLLSNNNVILIDEKTKIEKVISNIIKIFKKNQNLYLIDTNLNVTEFESQKIIANDAIHLYSNYNYQFIIKLNKENDPIINNDDSSI